MHEPPKPIARPPFFRPATAVLLITTISCVTECSEGDGHLSSVIGFGSFWLELHAMPRIWMFYLPDGLHVVTEHLLWMVGVAVLTLALFAACERFGIGEGPWRIVWATWVMSWLGTLLPFPFLFLAFLGPFAMLPALAIALIVGVIRRMRAPPSG